MARTRAQTSLGVVTLVVVSALLTFVGSPPALTSEDGDDSSITPAGCDSASLPRPGCRARFPDGTGSVAVPHGAMPAT
jgi:hypothetical protein